MTERVVVVGASVGGVAFAQRYRQKGGVGEVVLIGAERHLPYDRPPLSKKALIDEAWDPGANGLAKPEWYAEQGVQLRAATTAARLLADQPAVELDDGTVVAGSQMVLATGSRPRMLPAFPPSDSVRYLRDVDDSLALKARLVPGARVVVLGAGFIGLETAAAAHHRGCDVVVLEREASPLVRVLGAELGRLCTRAYDAAGVAIRCGVLAEGLADGGVAIAGGEVVPADVVVVGVGAQPNLEWLEGSGLAIDGGVVCDASGRTSTPGVWAIGDIARWPNAMTGRADRVEQWQAARDHGTVAAEALLGLPDATWTAAPYFWSDQLGGKVQLLGRSAPDAPAHVIDTGEQVVAVIGAERLEGVLTLNAPRALSGGRRLLTGGASLDEARTWADTALA